MITTISFFICAIMIVLLSLLMITRRQPVAAAMTLVVIMILLAGMYGLLGAHLSAVAQIIVYAGAIMVVFVFVIMLLNLPLSKLPKSRLTVVETVLILMGLAMALFLGTKAGFGYLKKLFLYSNLPEFTATQQHFPASENVKNVSALMFTDYLWPFELVSFLILVAVVGAVVLAKTEKKKQEKTNS